tara:strand:- start:825 stop:1007 length:183 start_codon:yes stop_codon:yes gene_type:complete
MTIEEYKDLLLEDELKIGYEVEDDLPDQYDEIEDDSYVDGLLTDGMSEMFGEEVVGFSLS